MALDPLVLPFQFLAAGPAESPKVGANFDALIYYMANSGIGTGTVNSGTQNKLAYYATTGDSVSGLTAITASRALASDANGLPVASTTTATELGYVNGVTSAIQTQMNLKAPLASPTFSGTITTPLTASRALQTGAASELAISATTSTELGYVNGVTSAIQTQLNAKATDSLVVHLAGSETITGVKIFSSDVTVPSINASGVWAFRNRIMNGDMRIDQRNAGASTTPATGVYFIDRFRTTITGVGVFSAQSQTTTVATGFTHALLLTVTTNDASIAATDNYTIQQHIEGNVVKDLLWGSASAKSIALSFWVRSSITGTYGIGIRNSANDRSYLAQYTINAANTFENKTITITGDTSGTWLTTNGVGIRLLFDLGSGSNFEGTANAWQAGSLHRVSGNASWIGTNGSTFYLTGLQLEIGSQVTSFEYRPEAIELELCQRYFWKSFPQATAVAQNAGVTGALGIRAAIVSITAGVQVIFPTLMRTTPTFVFYNPSATNALWRNTTDAADSGAASTTGAGDVGVFVSVAETATDNAGDLLNIHMTASAEL